MKKAVVFLVVGLSLFACSTQQPCPTLPSPAVGGVITFDGWAHNLSTPGVEASGFVDAPTCTLNVVVTDASLPGPCVGTVYLYGANGYSRPTFVGSCYDSGNNPREAYGFFE